MFEKNYINDVTTLNPIKVKGTFYPETSQEIQQIIQQHDSISTGGGHFSMGGQTAHENSVHIDMRQFNKILNLDIAKKHITVQAGITWKEIQKAIDPHDLSISIMQTYSNFTVGGSVSVNVHGRYVGAGPLALSLVEFKFIDAQGEEQVADKASGKHYFEMLVGGYGSIGVITEVTLKLAENKNLKQVNKKMDIQTYFANIHDISQNKKAILHNADIYPPHYNKVNSVTWVETTERESVKDRIQIVKRFYPVEKYALWAISETPLGEYRREHLYDKLIFSKNRVYKRNYEASYDVAELEPLSRKHSTYVLQEYFIPIENAENFVKKLAKVFNTYHANILNISIRHSIKNEDSLLSWSPSEVLAFVVYYKQGTSEQAKNAVSVWTRKAIDAAISENGAYYLPYQPHATKEQLMQAYPNFERFEENKKRLDPHYKFRNSLFDAYIYPKPQKEEGNFYDILHDKRYQDKLFDFLRFVFRTDEKKVFHNVLSAYHDEEDKDATYLKIQKSSKLSAKVLTSPKTVKHIYQQLKIQNRVLLEQTKEILQNNVYKNSILMLEPTDINKATKLYNGDKTWDISKILKIVPAKTKNNYFIRDKGSLLHILNDLQEESIDLITVYGGLHHLGKDERTQIHQQIYKLLRKGGHFILREHDVKDAKMFQFVSLIHAVFNAVTNESLEAENTEIREFESIDTIVKDIEVQGFKDTKKRCKQEGDPSDNILLGFVK